MFNDLGLPFFLAVFLELFPGALLTTRGAGSLGLFLFPLLFQPIADWPYPVWVAVWVCLISWCWTACPLLPFFGGAWLIL